MAEFPAMPLWTDAYLADTSHLTTTEHGAYLLLLMVAWRTHDKRLPDDDKKLAKYARVTPGQWARLRPVLQEFFKVKDGHWTQGRLTDEAEAVRQHRERQSKAGKASALKRKGRHSTAVQPEGNQKATPYSYSTPNNSVTEVTDAGASPDKVFWDSAKAYLGKSKAGMIGKWVRDYGRDATAKAITAAQIERAVDPVPYIERVLRKRESGDGRDCKMTMPC
jgi:uncharacterized protein YdaU (DUF1376 family)